MVPREQKQKLQADPLKPNVGTEQYHFILILLVKTSQIQYQIQEEGKQTA